MNPLLNLDHSFKSAKQRSNRADQTKGHRASAPGLRGHSCGDLYPLTIVGTNFGRSWYAQNAITGKVTGLFKSQRAAEISARFLLSVKA